MTKIERVNIYDTSHTQKLDNMFYGFKLLNISYKYKYISVCIHMQREFKKYLFGALYVPATLDSKQECKPEFFF